MRLTRAYVVRAVACTSASTALLLGLNAELARADDPSPLPGVSKVPTPLATDKTSDNPTTIPTGGAPSLPGETGPGDKGYSEAPDNISDSKPPVKVDADAAGLRLADGAKLADPKVLDIKFVTEDLGGKERREESTVKAKFTLQAEVLFPKDSPKLNNNAKSRIKSITDEIKKQDSDQVNVFGFTDNLGSYEHGKTLSKKRAATVQAELAKNLGSNVNFNVRGYSEDYPIADNGTEEGRERNRRVEVSFPREG